MVAEFERVSMAMSKPDADLDALTNKMSRLQVRKGLAAPTLRTLYQLGACAIAGATHYIQVAHSLSVVRLVWCHFACLGSASTLSLSMKTKLVGCWNKLGGLLEQTC